MQFEEYDLKMHGVRLPEITLDSQDAALVGMTNKANHYDFLEALCFKGLDEKIQKGQVELSEKNKYLERIKTELAVIEEGGFVDYILLVWDIINFCKKSDISVGNGRGSACGSMVLYLIGVTKIVDPIKYDLYFERFISKARIKKTIVDGITYLDGGLLPDIDSDIGHLDRPKVIAYLLDKYPNKSCKLSTLSTLSTRILIKECGKIVGNHTEDIMNEVSGYVESIFGKVQSLDKTREDSKDFDKFCKDNPKVYQISKKLSGLIKNASSHASGYLVSFENLDKYIPVQLGSDGEVLSAYDMNDASKIAVKVDLLGLQDLTLVTRVCKRVGVDPETVDYHDPAIYEKLQHIETPYGLFQIGADSVFRAMQKIKPRNFDHLTALLAIARPGCFPFIDRYAEYVNNGKIEAYDEHLDKIFGETANVPLFQEQLMKCAHETFQLTLEQAEGIRKACGKKKKEEMEKYKDIIFSQAKKLNFSEDTASKYWDMLIASADYSFNKSHAAAYSTLSFLSLLCKFNHPIDFFIESLRLSSAKQDVISEIATIQKELLFFGIQLLPPDIVKSNLDFKEENGNIRYGLSSIKGVSEKTFEKLKMFIDSDKANKFQVFNAAKQSKLNIGVFSALIQAGALGSMGSNRPKLVFEAQLFNLLTDREKAWCLVNGERYDYDLFKIMADWKSCVSNGKQVFKETRLETLKTKATKYREIFAQNSKFPEFAAYIYERKLTGYCYSQRLNKIFESYANSSIEPVLSLRSLLPDEKMKVVGFVKTVENKTSKNKKKYSKIVIEDESGENEILIFEPKFSDFEKKGMIPKEEDIIMVDVTKWNDAVTVQTIRAFTDKIYIKLSDLKESKKEEEEKTHE